MIPEREEFEAAVDAFAGGAIDQHDFIEGRIVRRPRKDSPLVDQAYRDGYDAVLAIFDRIVGERDRYLNMTFQGWTGEKRLREQDSEINALRAERDAAVEELDRICAFSGGAITLGVERTAELAAARAEVAALTADKDAACTALDNIKVVLARVTAENERLRMALTEISGHGCYRANATAGPVGDALDHLSECVNIACAALAPCATEGK